VTTKFTSLQKNKRMDRVCPSCNNWGCNNDCRMKHGEKKVSSLTASDVKAIALQCIMDNAQSIRSDDQVKAIALACIEANKVYPRTDQDIKCIALQCIMDNAQESPDLSKFIDSDTAKKITQQCIDENAVTPISTDQIKAIALKCLVDNYPDIPEAVTPRTDAEIKLIALACINENQSEPVSPISDAEIKAIALTCILENMPDSGTGITAEEAKAIFLECMPDTMTPGAIKNLIQTCIDDAGFEPRTDSEIKTIAQACFEANHVEPLNEAQIKSIALQCVQDNAPDSPRTDDEIKNIALQCLVDNFPDIPDQLQPRTDDEIKAIAIQCILDNAPGIPSGEDIKNIALLCIQENQQDAITDEQIKALILDCLKDLPNIGNGISNQVTDVDIDCNNDGDLSVTVQQQTGGDQTGSYPLVKKVIDSLPKTSICFSYDNQNVFEPDSNGKTTLDFDMKVFKWDSDSFNHVGYDANLKCLEVPYCGPTKEDINECIVDALANIEIGGGNGLTPRTDLEIKAIAQACIDLLPDQTGITLVQAKQQAQSCIDQNIASGNLCLTSIDSDFDDITRELTITIVDPCGDKSTTQIIPGGDGGGITLQQAKSQAEICIADGIADGSIGPAYTMRCQNADLTYTNLNPVGAGNLFTVPYKAPIVVDPADSCCNTGMVLEFDPITKVLSASVGQSLGDAVNATFDMTDAIAGWLEINPAIDEDGCTPYSRCDH